MIKQQCSNYKSNSKGMNCGRTLITESGLTATQVGLIGDLKHKILNLELAENKIPIINQIINLLLSTMPVESLMQI